MQDRRRYRPAATVVAPVVAAGLVDSAVLTELRAIRDEIAKLSERVGASATREELRDYLPMTTFRDHLEQQRMISVNWRAWAPFAVSIVALLLSVIGHIGVTVR
jgi:predicted anti-sigma-YlaC factor YlaD